MIDVLIPVGPKDGEMAKICALSARHYIKDIGTVWIVGHRDLEIPDTVYVDEAQLPFSLGDVAARLGVSDRAGWYFQQLVKLHAPILIPDLRKQYLVVDADTFFLRECRFIEDGRPAFNLGIEYHEPYFEHMQRLHPNLVKPMMYSGITHTLVYDRIWLQEMISLIEHQHGGKNFWKIYLDEVDPAHREHSGAAENELYFTYCVLKHINDIVIKSVKWSNISNIDDINHADSYASLHWYLRDEDIDFDALRRKILQSS